MVYYRRTGIRIVSRIFSRYDFAIVTSQQNWKT
jgi:hypothetical protein